MTCWCRHQRPQSRLRQSRQTSRQQRALPQVQVQVRELELELELALGLGLGLELELE